MLPEKWSKLEPEKKKSQLTGSLVFIKNIQGKLWIILSCIQIIINCILPRTGSPYYHATLQALVLKVEGALSLRIAMLLSADFLKLVLIALLIAFPITWWIMERWLDDFAYRVDIKPDIFLLAGCSMIVITMVTICVQSIKAAISNYSRNFED